MHCEKSRQSIKWKERQVISSWKGGRQSLNINLVPAILLGHRDSRPLGGRVLHCDEVRQSLGVNRPHRAQKGLVELFTGVLGVHFLQNVNGPTHAHTLVYTVFADEHVGDNFSSAAAKLDALRIIRGDARL